MRALCVVLGCSFCLQDVGQACCILMWKLALLCLVSQTALSRSVHGILFTCSVQGHHSQRRMHGGVLGQMLALSFWLCESSA